MWSGSPGADGLPGVPARVGCRKIQGLQKPGFPVGAVVGEGLAGPLAGDQDAASRVAEVFAAVSFAPAAPRPQVRPGVLGLDAVAQPVSAGRRARLVPQRVGEPGCVCVLGGSVRLVAVADVLGQVLGEIANAPGRIL